MLIQRKQLPAWIVAFRVVNNSSVEERQAIPPPSMVDGLSKFDRFQQNIDQTGAGLPKMVGIERPKEIQQRIEAEEAQKQGATHIYDPNQKKVVPVGWFQRHFQGMPGVKP